MLLNLFATGSTDGLVVIWDFEMSKIDDICYLPNGKLDKINVNALKFFDPYAVLMLLRWNNIFVGNKTQ